MLITWKNSQIYLHLNMVICILCSFIYRSNITYIFTVSEQSACPYFFEENEDGRQMSLELPEIEEVSRTFNTSDIRFHFPKSEVLNVLDTSSISGKSNDISLQSSFSSKEVELPVIRLRYFNDVTVEELEVRARTSTAGIHVIHC